MTSTQICHTDLATLAKADAQLAKALDGTLGANERHRAYGRACLLLSRLDPAVIRVAAGYRNNGGSRNRIQTIITPHSGKEKP